MSDEVDPIQKFAEIHELLFPTGNVRNDDLKLQQSINRVASMGFTGVNDVVSSFIASGGDVNKLRELLSMRAMDRMSDASVIAKEIVSLSMQARDKLQ